MFCVRNKWNSRHTCQESILPEDKNKYAVKQSWLPNPKPKIVFETPNVYKNKVERFDLKCIPLVNRKKGHWRVTQKNSVFTSKNRCEKEFLCFICLNFRLFINWEVEVYSQLSKLKSCRQWNWWLFCWLLSDKRKLRSNAYLSLLCILTKLWCDTR